MKALALVLLLPCAASAAKTVELRVTEDDAVFVLQHEMEVGAQANFVGPVDSADGESRGAR